MDWHSEIDAHHFTHTPLQLIRSATMSAVPLSWSWQSVEQRTVADSSLCARCAVAAGIVAAALHASHIRAHGMSNCMSLAHAARSSFVPAVSTRLRLQLRRLAASPLANATRLHSALQRMQAMTAHPSDLLSVALSLLCRRICARHTGSHSDFSMNCHHRKSSDHHQHASN